MQWISDRPRLFGFAIVAIAFVEVAGHIAIRARVPRSEHWAATAAFIDEAFEEGDRIVAAPSWGDPLVRHYLGHRISVADAAASDLAGVHRLWVVSIRGARSSWAPARPPDETHAFGRVRVERWSMAQPEVVYDFVSHVADAKVELVEQGQARDCRWRHARPGRGGLDVGAMSPTMRFDCDPKRPWLWVGPTVLTDIDFRPRRCIWQHPAGPEPVRTTFTDVPRGDRLVVYAGIYHRDERTREFPPALVRVLVGGQEAGNILHHDGDGWHRLEIPIPTEAGKQSVTVAVETIAEAPHRRTLCWSATVQNVGEP